MSIEMILVSSALEGARKQANSSHPDVRLMEWYDGRCSAVWLCFAEKETMRDAQSAINEIRFLMNNYIKRHGKS